MTLAHIFEKCYHPVIKQNEWIVISTIIFVLYVAIIYAVKISKTTSNFPLFIFSEKSTAKGINVKSCTFVI